MEMNELIAVKAKNLPHGHQRKLGLCIALITRPELLLLDEPVTGMNPIESEDMIRHIQKIRGELGITVVIIEHNMKVLMGNFRPHRGHQLRQTDRRRAPSGNTAK